MQQIANNSDEQNVIAADPGLDIEEFQQEVCRLIGLPDTIPISLAIQQLTGGLVPFTPENQEKINFLLAFVVAQNPSSLLEAQMIIQLVSAHHLFTEMMQKATGERWPENIDKYVNIAMKLSRGYKNGLEALSKYRRDGKQFFHIEHVHVEKDASAVIGNMNKG